MLETTAKIGIHATDNPLVATIGALKQLLARDHMHQKTMLLQKQEFRIQKTYECHDGTESLVSVCLQIDFSKGVFSLKSEHSDFYHDNKFYFTEVKPMSDQAARLEALSLLITEALRAGSRIMEYYLQLNKGTNDD